SMPATSPQVSGVPIAERRRRRAARPQGQREGPAAAELALDTHLTAVHLDERLGHREAEAQAAPLVLEQPGGVSGDVEGREERLEHARAAGRVDSGTRVAHPDLGAAVPKAPRRERDATRIRRELDGVQQEVAQAISNLFALQLHGAKALAVVPTERLGAQRDYRAQLLGGGRGHGEDV